MNTLLQTALRDALRMDTLGALDFAESLHRGMEREGSTAALLGLTSEQHAKLVALFERAYADLTEARYIIDGES